MFVLGRQRVFGGCAGGGDLVDVGAARNAVAVAVVELCKGDVVGGVEDNGDDVVLAHAHVHEPVVAAAGERVCLNDVRGEVLWPGSEVAHEVFEVGRGGAGSEGDGAPVMEESAGCRGSGCRNALQEDVAAAEAGRGVWRRSEGACLLRESGLNARGVKVECFGSGCWGFGPEANGYNEAAQQEES